MSDPGSYARLQEHAGKWRADSLRLRGILKRECFCETLRAWGAPEEDNTCWPCKALAGGI